MSQYRRIEVGHGRVIIRAYMEIHTISLWRFLYCKSAQNFLSSLYEYVNEN